MPKNKLIARLFAIQVVFNIPKEAMDEIDAAYEEHYKDNGSVVTFRIDMEKILKKYDRKCICGEMNFILNEKCKKCGMQL